MIWIYFLLQPTTHRHVPTPVQMVAALPRQQLQRGLSYHSPRVGVNADMERLRSRLLILPKRVSASCGLRTG